MSRRSFSFYLYTETRPPEEIATEHSTVYMPWPIPDVDSAADLDLDGIRLDNRKNRELVQSLYALETSLRATIHNEREWTRLVRPPFLGYMTAEPGFAGLHANLGAAGSVTIPLTAARPVDRLTVHGHLPDHLAGNTLTLRLGAHDTGPVAVTFAVGIDADLGPGETAELEITAERAPTLDEFGLSSDVRP